MAVDHDAMLLHGGKMAKLADIMQASVTGEEGTDRPQVGRPQAAAAPEPHINMGIPFWETIIIRGDKYEIKKFPMPKEWEHDG